MDIGNSLQNAFDTLFGFLPNLLGFLVILVIGYIVARVVQALASRVLREVGVDRMLGESAGGRFLERTLPGASASRGVARLLFWFVLAFFVVAAIGALRIDALTSFMNSVLSYLPNIIVAILIFIVAAAVAGLAGSAASRLLGQKPIGRMVGSVVPALVMVIATFMILDQLQIAPHIVSIAFAATMFAIALGLALAFGLGGRDVARQMLEEAYAYGRRDGASGSYTVAGGHARDDRPYRAHHPAEHRATLGATAGGARATATTRTTAVEADGDGYRVDPSG